jgi:site-specific recombinase XerD
LKLPIPRGIRHLYPSATGKPRTHVEESLGTKDLNEANRSKHARIAHYYAEFRTKERAAAGTLPPDMADAKKWREALREAESEEEREAIREYTIRPQAEDIAERRGDMEAAVQFHRLATAKLTLREAWAEWRVEWKITEAAKLKYEQAFRELLEFMRVADAPPADVTSAKARAYVRWLNTEAQSERGGPLSKSTKEGRLSPLRTFWAEYLIHHELVQGNPWVGHKLTGERTNPKRPYTDAEILALLDGPDRGRSGGFRYPKRTIIEMYALAFYTGARRGEIANRLLGDFTKIRGGYVMRIRDAKTQAGDRAIPVLHPIPVAVIKARIGKRTDPKAQLFEEFTPSGPDADLGENIGKSMGHYRDAVGITTEADFHSTRRQLITALVAQGHSKELVQFYVGHKVPGVTGIYAKPTHEGMRKIAQAIEYPPKIERAFRAALAGGA